MMTLTPTFDHSSLTTFVFHVDNDEVEIQFDHVSACIFIVRNGNEVISFNSYKHIYDAIVSADFNGKSFFDYVELRYMHSLSMSLETA